MKLNIPKANGVDLSNTDVLVCEVNERRTGKTKDFEILKAYWEDWFERMNAHKVSFIQREQANDLTKKELKNFLRISVASSCCFCLVSYKKYRVVRAKCKVDF